MTLILTEINDQQLFKEHYEDDLSPQNFTLDRSELNVSALTEFRNIISVNSLVNPITLSYNISWIYLCNSSSNL